MDSVNSRAKCDPTLISHDALVMMITIILLFSLESVYVCQGFEVNKL